ncbi:MAG: ABC transporter ATP-binding protein [Pseudomonadota bacterium]|nr:ABC transporter ATP-binding protein [Rubrivivax sp.]
MSLLEVRDLRVAFGRFPAVDGVDFALGAGELLGIVGESGSGKSMAMLALMGLVDPPGRVHAARLAFDGHDLLALRAADRRRIVGRDLAMVFQDASSSLNPSHRVGDQVREVLRAHLGLRGERLERRVLELFEQVEIPDARRRLDAWPHELSGGMNQRVMIAMAIACRPRLLIADEPTTALDVTIQAQVMALLARLQSEHAMALVLVTHDLALMAQTARAAGARGHRVAVMYAGQVLESGRAGQLFVQPRHPYTAALLAALPEAGAHGGGARHRRLAALPGIVPGSADRPRGCLFAPRCRYAQARCRAERPALEADVRCFYPLAPEAPAAAADD